MIKNRKILKVFILTLLIFATTNSTFSYPITYYDTDLSDEQRELIAKKYDAVEEEKRLKKEAEKESTSEEKSEEKSKDKIKKDANENATNIEGDYLDYEKNNVDNLAITKIEESYNYRVLNKNTPDFDIRDYKLEVFETYSELDSLGRSGVAVALLGKETMPKDGEKRENIGMIKPTGWQTPISKYDFIEGKYLYNRCHLIGWQLSDENANVKNLFTGTRWLNTKGMLPFENQVANYIKATGNHVLYRVTPIFEGSNLLASRVQIEALSYEDNGNGIKFNVLLENYQPGVYIEYSDGSNFVELDEREVGYEKA